MEIELTRELRQAIDETKGEPVYIVDSDRHETFVLLTSADFDRVRPMLGVRDSNGEWTDEKNRRRVELIDKKIAGTITTLESVELASLQEQAEAHFDQVAPPPMQGVTELHRQLLSRDSQ
jgi:hypothetical protein